MLFCQKNISVDGKILYTIVRLYEISCNYSNIISNFRQYLYILEKKEREITKWGYNIGEEKL